MFTLLRVLIVWRLVRLLAPLAICGLLVLLLAMAHTERGHSPSRGSLTRPVAISRELQRALGPESVAARRALTAAFLSGAHR
jgi:hypothetical protein